MNRINIVTCEQCGKDKPVQSMGVKDCLECEQ